MREDVPIYPSPEFGLCASSREKKLKCAKADAHRRLEEVLKKHGTLDDGAEKRNYGSALKSVIMRRHRSNLVRMKEHEFSRRTLAMRGRKFDFKWDQGKKSAYIKHVLPFPHDVAFFHTQHYFQIFDEKGADITSTKNPSECLTGETATGYDQIGVKWTSGNTKIILDTGAMERGEMPCVAVKPI